MNNEELALASPDETEEDTSFNFGFNGDEDFTIDPELALASEGVEGPRPLVREEIREPEKGYEIALVMDPDGRMFGVCREWSFTVESLDTAYSPSRTLRDMLRSTEWADGETTEVVEQYLQQVFMPRLRKRDRIVARSKDGERVILLTRTQCQRVCKPEAPRTP